MDLFFTSLFYMGCAVVPANNLKMQFPALQLHKDTKCPHIERVKSEWERDFEYSLFEY